MTTLLIVESRAKCATIAGFFPKGELRCIASGGHVRETTGGLDVLSSDFTPGFKSKRSVTGLRAAAAGAQRVLLGTDDDREGEAIAWHLCVVLKLPLTTPRVVFREITQSALVAAVARPRQLDMARVDAQLARTVVDMLVGFKVSPALWRMVAGKNRGLSAGRCQTPALRLVVEAGTGDPPIPVHRVTATFDREGDSLELVLMDTLESDAALREFAAATVDHQHVATVGGISEHVFTAPHALTTARLQQSASSVLGLSPKTTMKAAGSLYSAGFITYPRTDSTVHASDFAAAARAYIDERYGPGLSATASKRHSKSAHAQEAHEAVRCTRPSVVDGPQDPTERRLYHLIWQNSLQQHMLPATRWRRTVMVRGPGRAKYSAEAVLVRTPGWMLTLDDGPPPPTRAWMWAAAHDGTTDVGLVVAQSAPRGKGGPRHLGEASLVNALESKGIGRPSTYAGIVGTLLERKYATVDDVPGVPWSGLAVTVTTEGVVERTVDAILGKQTRRLVATDLGKRVLAVCDDHFGEVFDYGYTASLEADLDEVAAGRVGRTSVCLRVSERLDAALAAVAGNSGNSSNSSNSSRAAWSGRGTGAPSLGTHDGDPVTVHDGRYGSYVRWRENTYSLGRHRATLASAVDIIRRTRDLGGGWKALPGKSGRGDYAQKGSSSAGFVRVPLSGYPGDHLADAPELVIAWLKSSRP